MTFRPHQLGLWALSFVVVLGLHAALFFWALYWRPAAPPTEAPPAAMLIQLEALPAPLPPPAPPKPVVLPEPEPLPKLVEAPKPKLAIAKPKPKPKPKPPEPKPEPPKPAEPAPPAQTPPSPAKPAAESPPAAPQAAPVSDTDNLEASWKAKLMARLARYEQYPDDARRRGLQGVVKVRFVVDASGRVLSQEVVSSSGHRSLDRAVLRQIRRAQPLPKPPGEILRNGSREVTAPFKYELKR